MAAFLSVEVAHAGRAVRGAAERAECGAAEPVGGSPGAGTPAWLWGARTVEGAKQPVGRAGRYLAEFGQEPGDAGAGGGELSVGRASRRVLDRELDHRVDRPGRPAALEEDLVQGALGDPGVDRRLVGVPVADERGRCDAEVGEDVTDGA